MKEAWQTFIFGQGFVIAVIGTFVVGEKLGLSSDMIGFFVGTISGAMIVGFLA
jgi:hypothetical protein